MNVSIIIPVYQVASCIKDCLISVMRQTYVGSMECIIVDDGSTDCSIAIAEQLILEYKGPVCFRFLHHKQNRGLSSARNTGTLHAKGEFLYYLDADDEIAENCIEILMRKIEELPELELVQGNALWQYSSHKSIIQIKHILLPLTVTNKEVRKCFCQYKQMKINVWNKLIRRDLIIQNNIFCREGLLFEDLLWSFNLLKVLRKVSFVSEVTYFHKVRLNSIMTGTDKRTKIISYCAIYYEMMNHLTPDFEQEELNYFTRLIIFLHFRFGYDVKEFNDVFKLYRNQCKRYCGLWSYVQLEVAYFLGKSIIGRCAWSLARKVKHPIMK